MIDVTEVRHAPDTLERPTVEGGGVVAERLQDQHRHDDDQRRHEEAAHPARLTARRPPVGALLRVATVVRLTHLEILLEQTNDVSREEHERFVLGRLDTLAEARHELATLRDRARLEDLAGLRVDEFDACGQARVP